MPERNPGALVLFGAVAAVGSVAVTVWRIAAEHSELRPLLLAMGALGLAGGAVAAARPRAWWWVGLLCGAALLVLSFWRLGDVGVYYMPFAMLLMAMGQALLRERLSSPKPPSSKTLG